MKTAARIVVRTVIALIVLVVVAAVLFPIFAQAKEAGGPGPMCLSDLKQLAVGTIMYSGDYDERAPIASKWASLTVPYVNNVDVFHCSELRGAETDCGHVFHSSLDRRVLTGFQHPERQVMFFESTDLSWNGNRGLDSLPPKPRGRQTRYPFAFVDGHTSRMSRKEVVRFGVIGHR